MEALNSPANLDPSQRAAIQRQMDILEVRRSQAQRELDRVTSDAASIDAETSDSRRAVQQLSQDSVSDVLDILQGILALSGSEVPSETKAQVDLLLNTAKFSVSSTAAINAPSGSGRKASAALDALTALTGALTAVPPAGVSVQAWEALRYAVGDMARLLRSSTDGSVSFPTDANRLWRLASCVDQIVELAGKLPGVGPPISGLHSAGQLLVRTIGPARVRLMSDRKELDTATAISNSAVRYWTTRIAEIEGLEVPYQVDLGQKPSFR
jgi:hypothetical protein